MPLGRSRCKVRYGLIMLFEGVGEADAILHPSYLLQFLEDQLVDMHCSLDVHLQ